LRHQSIERIDDVMSLKNERSNKSVMSALYLTVTSQSLSLTVLQRILITFWDYKIESTLGY